MNKVKIQSYLSEAWELQKNNNFDAARSMYERVLRFEPVNINALYLLAVLETQTKNHRRGLKLSEQAITINPDVAEFHNARGNALRFLERLPEALSSFNRALQIKPNYPEALNNRGITLRDLNRAHEALHDFDSSLSINAKSAIAHNNRGLALKDLGYAEAALESFNAAISISPRYAQAYANRGNLFIALKRYGDAIQSFEKALEINQNLDFLLGLRLHTKLKIADWSNFETDRDFLSQKINEGQRSTPPFPILGIFDNPELEIRAAEAWINSIDKPNLPLSKKASTNHGKIRVAYYSANFCNHAVAYLIAELFEIHDRDEFEIFGFSLDREKDDQMSNRICRGVDEFFNVFASSSSEIAQKSRDLDIDIAVDLMGHTGSSRPEIFAHRCAPIQVSYLGYPGTMGASYIDYLIADNTVILDSQREFFSEKIIYLPDSYQVNDSKRQIYEEAPSRSEVGIPDDCFVFCCFNNTYKILPETFKSWMHILDQTPGSVLWLIEDSSEAVRNLEKNASDCGVDPKRLIFAKKIDLDKHLARQTLADLFIDTYPYNAHTTASDALWAGVPVLTLQGKSFASRVASSLLRAMGLDDLITTSREEYEKKAIRFASSPTELSEIRKLIGVRKTNSALFDTKTFARNLETAYKQIYANYVNDVTPHDIHVNK